MVKRISPTETQLIELYNKIKMGDKRDEVAYSMGWDEYKVSNSYYRIIKAMKIISSGKQPSRASTYVAVAYKLLKHNVIGKEKTFVSEQDKIKHDRYEDLDQAFTSFQQAIGVFVKAEVEEKIGKVIKENEEMRKLLEETKHSNFIGTLKKQLQGE
jgi:predicted transcriptional regulator